MTIPYWERAQGKLIRIRNKQRHPKAHIPNKPSPPVKHTPPTKKPGAGLTGKRKRLSRVMHATLGNPFGWTYYEVRPSTLSKRHLSEKAWRSAATLHAALAKLTTGSKFDCSFGVKDLFWLVDMHDDPTGERWTQWGNSVSTYDHLPKATRLNNAYHPAPADLAKCKVGWIVLFGENGKWHMTAIMEEGADPLLWSDGGPGSTTPKSYRLSADTRRPISVCIPKGLE